MAMDCYEVRHVEASICDWSYWTGGGRWFYDTRRYDIGVTLREPLVVAGLPFPLREFTTHDLSARQAAELMQWLFERCHVESSWITNHSCPAPKATP